LGEGLPRQDRPWIAQARGALVALHLLAITLMAFPAPSARSLIPANWQAPDAQEELATWADNLGQLGIATTKEELAERVWGLASAYSNIHQQLLVPFRPYYDYCGTYQSWHMFGTIARYPTRLHIDIEEKGGEWSPVYIERDPKHDWLGRYLDHSRFRPVLFRFGLHEDEDDFPGLAEWVARHAARDFPRAKRVRVRYSEQATLSAEEVRAGKKPIEHFRTPIILALAKFR
jgi:hypothetical protein